jgi:hypothetical protein
MITATVLEPEELLALEKHLDAGDLRAAAGCLHALSIPYSLRRVRPMTFDRCLKRDPSNDLFLELRGTICLGAQLHEDAIRDLVRSLLLARGRKACLERTGLLARALAKGEIEPWMRRALDALEARLSRNEEAERKHLLAAIGLAPTEATLFVALARNQAGTASELELFALGIAVRCAPGWARGRLLLARAQRRSGDLAAARRTIVTLIQWHPEFLPAFLERTRIARARAREQRQKSSA